MPAAAAGPIRRGMKRAGSRVVVEGKIANNGSAPDPVNGGPGPYHPDPTI